MTIKSIKHIIIPIALGASVISILGGMVAMLKNNINDNNLIAQSGPPEVMCYYMVEVPTKEDNLEILNNQLKLLEKQYKEKKIDNAAYKTRKEDLNKRIKELEKYNNH